MQYRALEATRNSLTGNEIDRLFEPTSGGLDYACMHGYQLL